jgi:cytochrome c oxidase assembly protein subunit 11
MSEPVKAERGKRRTLLWLAALTLGMFGFGFALVPLYGVLCKITGAPSIGQRVALNTPEAAGSADEPVQGRWVTIKFDATVNPDLPWTLRPIQQELRVHPGEMHEVRFLAENRSSHTITGQAIPGFVPWQATAFVHKLECFCFRQQTLKGWESKEMPLRFVISPELPAEIKDITLSYSVMRVPDAQQAAGR